MTIQVTCTECGGHEFEERGNIRCYVQGEFERDEAGNVDWVPGTWSAPHETYEPDDDGELYCVECACDFRVEVLAATAVEIVEV